jgi:D-tyrosyl-tRNA(Tyr) deacylase
MAEQTDGDGTRGELEHDQAVSLARRRARKQLDALAAHCPGHQITVETYPGREDRYVARAMTGSARPYLLITTDLSELCAELCGPGRRPWLTALPQRTPGVSWRPPPSV